MWYLPLFTLTFLCAVWVEIQYDQQNRALFREKCVCHEDSILEATEES